MKKNVSRISRIRQKIAVLLAVVLAIPFSPLAGIMGLEQVEVKAGATRTFGLNLGDGIEDEYRLEYPSFNVVFHAKDGYYVYASTDSSAPAAPKAGEEVSGDTWKRDKIVPVSGNSGDSVTVYYWQVPVSTDTTEVMKVFYGTGEIESGSVVFRPGVADGIKIVDFTHIDLGDPIQTSDMSDFYVRGNILVTVEAEEGNYVYASTSATAPAAPTAGQEVDGNIWKELLQVNVNGYQGETTTLYYWQVPVSTKTVDDVEKTVYGVDGADSVSVTSGQVKYHFDNTAPVINSINVSGVSANDLCGDIAADTENCFNRVVNTANDLVQISVDADEDFFYEFADGDTLVNGLGNHDISFVVTNMAGCRSEIQNISVALWIRETVNMEKRNFVYDGNVLDASDFGFSVSSGINANTPVLSFSRDGKNKIDGFVPKDAGTYYVKADYAIDRNNFSLPATSGWQKFEIVNKLVVENDTNEPAEVIVYIDQAGTNELIYDFTGEVDSRIQGLITQEANYMLDIEGTGDKAGTLIKDSVIGSVLDAAPVAVRDSDGKFLIRYKLSQALVDHPSSTDFIFKVTVSNDYTYEQIVTLHMFVVPKDYRIHIMDTIGDVVYGTPYEPILYLELAEPPEFYVKYHFYDTDRGTGSYEKPVNVGNYSVSAMYWNYETRGYTESVDFSIVPAVLSSTSFRLGSTNIAANGSEPVISLSENGLSLGEGASVSAKYSTKADASGGDLKSFNEIRSVNGTYYVYVTTNGATNYTDVNNLRLSQQLTISASSAPEEEETVEEKSVEVTGISINPATATVEEKSTTQLTAVFTPEDQTENPEVTWTSSDTTVATVDQTGLVTGVKAGKATITAKITGTGGEFSAVSEVTVSEKIVPVSSVTLNNTIISVKKESTATLTATVLPEDASDREVTWTTGDPSIATVAGGTVTGVKAGTTTITATAGDKSATAIVTVTEEEAEGEGEQTDLTDLIEDTGDGQKLADVIREVVDNTEDGTVTKIWIGGIESSYPYTGKAIKPAIHVYDGIKQLSTSDYSVSYKNNKDAGEAAEIIVKFNGNYKGTADQTVKFTIAKVDLGDISIPDVAVKKGSEPKFKLVTDTGLTVPAKAYSIAYDVTDIKKAEPGEYTATFTPGDTTNYEGSQTATVTVIGKSDKNRDLANGNLKLEYTSAVWTGKAIEPTVTVTDSAKATVDPSKYEVSYLNNTAVGKATVIVTANDSSEDGYVGSKTATFTINKGKAEGVEFSIAESVEYSAAGARAAVTVTDSNTGAALKEGTDYKVEYSKNTEVTTSAEAKITGKGIYSFSKTLTFKITPADISKVSFVASDVVGAAKWNKPKLTVTDGGRKVPRKYYKAPVFTIDREAVTSASEGSKVTVTIEGDGTTYIGSVSATYRIIDKSNDISRAKAGKIADKVYNGSRVTLNNSDLTGLLTLNNKTLIPGKDFVVEGYAKNDKKGTARVTLRGIVNGDTIYGGTRTVTFKIVEKKGAWKDNGMTLVDGEWKN